MDDLIGEDFSGGDVVAVAESAREGEELKIVEKGRIFEQPINMQKLRVCAGEFEGVGGLGFAICAGGRRIRVFGFIDDKFISC